MPKLVKIGKTGRGVETRLNDLYTTDVPLPFEFTYAAGGGHGHGGESLPQRLWAIQGQP